MDFEARTYSVDGTDVVQVRGELDLASAPALDEALRAAGRERLVVDASALTFIDVVGTAVLQRHHEELVAGGGSLVVRGAPPALRRILELTGRDGTLVLEDD